MWTSWAPVPKKPTVSVDVKQHFNQLELVKTNLKNVSRFGLAVRRWAGKQKGLGSIPLRVSFLFKKVVVCGHCLVTLSLTVNKTLKWLS